MATDVDDDAELIPNHNEAWSLAHYKRGSSNMARAYIELRELARKGFDGLMTVADEDRLRAIVTANDI